MWNMASLLLLWCFLVWIVRPKDCCWCDEDTLINDSTILGDDDELYNLVMSDEFNTVGRVFDSGIDPKWTALDRPDNSNSAQQYYLPSEVTTVQDITSIEKVGALKISAKRRDYGDKAFTSAMLQGWNKFCFTGGIVEIRVKIPYGGGWWPAIWMFGNLGRVLHEQSISNVWPWSYDVCDPVFEQKMLPKERPRLSTCHHNPEDKLLSRQGRGAPEINLIEGWGNPDGSGEAIQSLKVAPRIPHWFRPIKNTEPTTSGQYSWYQGLIHGQNTEINTATYGPTDGTCVASCPDVISFTTHSSDISFNYHVLRFEWKTGSDGYLKYMWDDTMTAIIQAQTLSRLYANKKDFAPPRIIPNEPMYFIINIAVSKNFAGGPNAIILDPGELFVDYVRVYQHPDRINVGCSPPDYPTADYIIENKELYGHPFPANPLGSDTCFHEISPSVKPQIRLLVYILPGVGVCVLLSIMFPIFILYKRSNRKNRKKKMPKNLQHSLLAKPANEKIRMTKNEKILTI